MKEHVVLFLVVPCIRDHMETTTPVNRTEHGKWYMIHGFERASPAKTRSDADLNNLEII